MFRELFGRFGCGCGCEEEKCKTTSCDVMWIIILLLIVFKGGLFGIDICTIVILFIVFGKDLFFKRKEEKCCC